MPRFFPPPPTFSLPALAIASLLLGWWTGYWTLGAGVALLAFCGLAIVTPRGSIAETPLRLINGLRGNLSSNYAWLGKFGPPSKIAPSTPSAPPDTEALPPDGTQPFSAVQISLVDQMIHQGRFALLLRPQIAANLAPSDLQQTQEALDNAMAMVPEGQVALRSRASEAWVQGPAPRAERLIRVEGFFLDRCAVTNRQYYEFVSGGGYDQMSLWDEALWPAVLTFVDRTGHPGPRFWEKGRFLRGQEDLPIVGVSWYEACAFARWAGKRLPTDAEWVKTASWPVMAVGDKPLQRRYPWGDAMDRRLANIWGSGFDKPIPVQSLPDGASANGVLQLVGNVWEWTSTPFGAWEPPQHKVETGGLLKSIRGGAFDTYFETQAHSQFQSGESPLSRKHNIGFRCALGFCDVVDSADGDHSPPSEKAQTNEVEEVLV